MAVKMKALYSFTGTEGFVKAGEVFEAADEDRAKELENMDLAERADEGAEVTQEKPLKEFSVDELKDKAKELNISGYSSMNKTELVTAIQQAESTQENSPEGDPGTNPAQEQPNTEDNK